MIAVLATKGKVERAPRERAPDLPRREFHSYAPATIRDYAIGELTTFPASRFDDLTHAICLAITDMEATEEVVSKWSAMAGDPREKGWLQAHGHRFRR